MCPCVATAVNQNIGNIGVSGSGLIGKKVPRGYGWVEKVNKIDPLGTQLVVCYQIPAQNIIINNYNSLFGFPPPNIGIYI